MTSDDLLVWTEGRIGRLRLNRPEALNALTHDMALGIEKALLGWRDDPEIDAVLICATGDRAFCAGGDIQDLYHSGRKSPEPGRKFWRDEYRLNALIKSYPKPYIAVMNGITMGGGVGVSAHGSHRIVTEKTMVAMPETSIGFIPDVGGTYLLSRAPGETGIYLGLSGARMNAADAIFAGFADHYIPTKRLPDQAASLTDGASADEAVADVAAAAPDGKLESLQEKISQAFAQSGPLDCVRELQRMAESGDEWAEKTRNMIAKNSPFAVAATFAAIHKARKLQTLEECLSLEYNFAYRAIAGHEFLEGIRAMVIDKDRKPDWQPATLEDVTTTMVEDALAPLGEAEWKAA
ncbi:MAG: enoyl-CoA hydratase/isomerase family protein [Hyphomicrobiaceae bacterium]|nr:enoyl-CoA hydratase/isomerase family protein [Hyphomicrobiaceae bacterium]